MVSQTCTDEEQALYSYFYQLIQTLCNSLLFCMNKAPNKQQYVLLMLELSLLSLYCTFSHWFNGPSMLITTCF